MDRQPEIIEKRIDIMVDIETLGVKLDSLVIQIAAVPFNIYGNGKYSSYFDETLNMNSMENININPKTLLWWLDTNPNLLSSLLNRKGKSTQELFNSFEKYINSWKYLLYDVYLWGNGINFDNAIIKTNLKEKYPIFYKNDRDVRTLIEIASLKSKLTETEIKNTIEFIGDKHNAVDDCRHQIKIVQKCFNLILKGNK